MYFWSQKYQKRGDSDFPAPLKRPRMGGVMDIKCSMRVRGLCFTKLSFFVPTRQGALSARDAESAAPK